MPGKDTSQKGKIDTDKNFRRLLNKYSTEPNPYQLSLEEFESNYPDNYRQYLKAEYLNPKNDPWVKAAKEKIDLKINTDDRIEKAKTYEQQREVRKELSDKYSEQEWNDFVKNYQTKAKVYRNRHDGITKALEKFGPVTPSDVRTRPTNINTALTYTSVSEKRAGNKVVQGNNFKLVFRFSPTEPDREKKPQGLIDRAHKLLDRQQNKEAEQFKKDVLAIGGNITFSPEERVSLIARGVLPSDHHQGDINPALLAMAFGVDINTYADKVSRIQRHPKMSDEEFESLKSSMLVSIDAFQSMAVADDYLYTGLRNISQRPQLTGVEVVYQEEVPVRSDQFVMDYSVNTGMQPVMDLARTGVDRVTGKAREKIEGKVKDKVTGLLGKGAKKLGKKAGAEAFERISGQVVEKAVTALAAETGPLAPLIGKLAGYLYRKIVSKLLVRLKKWGKYLLAGGVALAGFGFLASSPFMILGGLALGGIGGFGIASAGVGGTIALFGSVVGAAMMAGLGSMLWTFMIALIVTPFLVAIIIFIITTSAYVVPGGVGSFTPNIVTNEYLLVEKKAYDEDSLFPGPFRNEDLPLDIEYTVTITARKLDVTNIRLIDTCNVLQEQGERACPRENPPLTNPPPTDVLPAGESRQFTYVRTFIDGNCPGSNCYEDAWIGDRVRVQFDAGIETNQEALANATIKIGDPPDFCPSGWPLPVGGQSYTLTQGAYGSTSHINNSLGYDSEAIDVGAITGTDVFATHQGSVIAIDDESEGYGKHVLVLSTCEGKEFLSVYGHLSAAIVDTGDKVEKGEPIGKVGSTGKSSGPHLHYEFRYVLEGGLDIAAGGRGDSWIKNPPYMMQKRNSTDINDVDNPEVIIPPDTTFYIPKDLPRECTTAAGCGWTSIP